ncbi:hypothetical protein D3C87_1880560 [compost metagenome]
MTCIRVFKSSMATASLACEILRSCALASAAASRMILRSVCDMPSHVFLLIRKGMPV